MGARRVALAPARFALDEPSLAGRGRSSTFALRADAVALGEARLKFSYVRRMPSSSGTVGENPRIFFALVMSGQRRLGSSAGSGLRTTSSFAPTSFETSSASSAMVHSLGLPRLTGESNSATRPAAKMPSTRSET